MTHRSWSLVAAACALLALPPACSDEEKKIAAVPSGPATSETDKRDAGTKPEEDEDAGKMDGGSPISLCTRIMGKAGAMDTAEVGTWVQSPGDLALTRQVERWTNDCSDLRLILEFSDGICPLGAGHSVTFSLSYQAVLDGVVHGGNNVVGPDSVTPAVSVRYRRPTKLKPNGTWGTCDGASGMLVFGSEPILAPGQYLSARYQLDLTPCEGGATADTAFLEGAFNVLLRTSRSDACPPTGGAGGGSGVGGFEAISGAGGVGGGFTGFSE